MKRLIKCEPESYQYIEDRRVLSVDQHLSSSNNSAEMCTWLKPFNCVIVSWIYLLLAVYTYFACVFTMVITIIKLYHLSKWTKNCFVYAPLLRKNLSQFLWCVSFTVVVPLPCTFPDTQVTPLYPSLICDQAHSMAFWNIQFFTVRLDDYMITLHRSMNKQLLGYSPKKYGNEYQDNFQYSRKYSTFMDLSLDEVQLM